MVEESGQVLAQMTFGRWLVAHPARLLAGAGPVAESSGSRVASQAILEAITVNGNLGAMLSLVTVESVGQKIL